jgi:hypothetical protein
VRIKYVSEKRNDPGFDLQPGANPTIASYNGSAVKNYNTTSSALYKQKYYFYFEKTLLPTMYNAGVVVINSEVVGLDPGQPFMIFAHILIRE